MDALVRKLASSLRLFPSGYYFTARPNDLLGRWQPWSQQGANVERHRSSNGTNARIKDRPTASASTIRNHVSLLLPYGKETYNGFQNNWIQQTVFKIRTLIDKNTALARRKSNLRRTEENAINTLLNTF